MEKKQLKRKYADVKKVKEIIDSKYVNMPVNTEEFKGNISFVEIFEASKEWIVDKGNPEERCILGKGIKWLEIYPEGKNYSITSIYNKNNEIVEWYIDIADKIGVEDGIPYEDDLYLDVVILPEGKVILLDEDELEDTYEKNLITKEQYDLSYKMANEIMENGKNRINDLKLFCDKYLKIMENSNVVDVGNSCKVIKNIE